MKESCMDVPVSPISQHPSCMMFPFLFAGAHTSGTGIFFPNLPGLPFLFCASVIGVSVLALFQSLEHIYLLVILTATVSTVVLVVVPMTTMMVPMVLT
jgi:hypothetical protein